MVFPDVILNEFTCCFSGELRGPGNLLIIGNKNPKKFIPPTSGLLGGPGRFIFGRPASIILGQIGFYASNNWEPPRNFQLGPSMRNPPFVSKRFFKFARDCLRPSSPGNLTVKST